MDELFELRNYFYMGNYSAALTEGKTIAVDSDALRIERDAIMARIAVAQGECDDVISSVSADAPVGMQAIKVLAAYSKDKAGQAEIAKLTITEWLQDPVAGSNPVLLFIAATILAEAGDWDEALRCAHRGQSLEHMALKVELLIKIDRVDAAAKEVNGMKRIDEDHTLTQLASAWASLGSGTKNGSQEALYTYQELLERHGATEMLLNGVAACHLSLNQFADAERVLQEALSKNPANPDTLVNMIAVAQHRQKPAELVKRYRDKLTEVAPQHTALAAYNAASNLLDALIANPPITS